MQFTGFDEATQQIVHRLAAGRGSIRQIEAHPADCLTVTVKGETASVGYSRKCELFRGLGYVLAAQGDMQLQERAKFDTLAVMVDFSRNAVMRAETVKRYLEYLALMGFNAFLPYTEEVYEVEGNPYFGYLRGRYTQNELREIDDYAHLLGIEVIPCIQTLGHLEQYLKWNEGDAVKDTASVLLAESEETYRFVEKMIDAACTPLRSKRIHIGMDEAHDIGLGRYLSKFGYRDRHEILTAHLNRVTDICTARGLSPMMWGDMFFRLASPRGAYYDPDIQFPEAVKERVPDGMGIIYWDYYTNQAGFYRRMMEKHQELSDNMLFAGAVWTYRGALPDYHTTHATTIPALRACLEAGVKEVIATLWGDDGAECSYFTALGGLQLYAEACYQPEFPTLETVRARYRDCTGEEYQFLLDISRFQNPTGETDEEMTARIGKFTTNDILRGRHQFGRRYLWQDILCGMFDHRLMEQPASMWYRQAAEQVGGHQCGAAFAPYQQLAEGVLALLTDKTFVAEHIIEAYRKKDRAAMRDIITRLRAVSEKAEQVRAIHRDIWMRENKPFGWETLDIRYGGLIARTDTAIVRLEQWLEGKLVVLEELEEERLPFARTAGDWRYTSVAAGGIL